MAKVIAVLLALAGLSAPARDPARADAEKPMKADVTVKDGDSSAVLKAGQTVEIEIATPARPPFPKDFQVTAGGKNVKFEVRDKPNVDPMGFPKLGGKLKAIYFTPTEAGKINLVVKYQKGDKAETREYNLEVK